MNASDFGVSAANPSSDLPLPDSGGLSTERVNRGFGRLNRNSAEAYSAHPKIRIGWRLIHQSSCAEIRRSDGKRGKLP
jgi:hypothetical protein